MYGVCDLVMNTEWSEAGRYLIPTFPQRSGELALKLRRHLPLRTLEMSAGRFHREATSLRENHGLMD